MVASRPTTTRLGLEAASNNELSESRARVRLRIRELDSNQRRAVQSRRSFPLDDPGIYRCSSAPDVKSFWGWAPKPEVGPQ